MSLSIAVYGATGAVGSTFLVHLLSSRLLKAGDRVLMVGRGTDDSRTALSAMCVDLLDAFDEKEVDIQVVGDLEGANADVFVMAAGHSASPDVKTRRDLADANASIFHETARRLHVASPAATVIIVTNPVELGVEIFSRHFDRRRVIGMGAQQDSFRFARAVAAKLGVRRSRVRASVYGEHGESMVPAWSSVYVTDPDPGLLAALIDLRIDHEGSDEVLETERAMATVSSLLDADRVASAYEVVEAASPQVKVRVEPFITVARLKSTPNATAHATLAFIAALVRADERKLHGQVFLDGEFGGIHGICGAPIELTQGGWRIASHQPLTRHELHRLEMARRATDYVFGFASGSPPASDPFDGPSGTRARPAGRD